MLVAALMHVDDRGLPSAPGVGSMRSVLAVQSVSESCAQVGRDRLSGGPCPEEARLSAGRCAPNQPGPGKDSTRPRLHCSVRSLSLTPLAPRADATVPGFSNALEHAAQRERGPRGGLATAELSLL